MISFKITCHLVSTEQWIGEQCGFAIKPFYKNNDSFVARTFMRTRMVGQPQYLTSDR